MKHYTFASRVGNKVFHRYWEDGKRHQEIVGEYPFEIFIPAANNVVPDAKSLYGDSLTRIKLDSVKELLESLENFKEMDIPVYGQTNAETQFLSSEYPGKIDFNLNNYVIMGFDIEVAHDDGFPKPEEAKDEIISITARVFGAERFITWGTKPYDGDDCDYVQCSDEADLLTKFVLWWANVNPDIVTGWNIETFDIPYIIERGKKILNPGIIQKLSPFHRNTTKALVPFITRGITEELAYRIVGVNVIDMLPTYKKFAPEKLESYRLDYVGEHEGVGNKVSLAPWGNSLMRLYREDYNFFVKYNVQDTNLVEGLDNKLQFIRLAITITLMTKSRYQEFNGSVQVWDNLIYNMLLEKGVVIPPKLHGGDSDKIVGGFVKEPIPQRYGWGVSVDATSLYPSIVRMFNMSPETIVETEKGVNEFMEHLLDMSYKIDKPDGSVMAANGTVFDQSVQGVLAQAMEMLFEERKRKKEEMKVVKRKKEAYIAANGKADTPELHAFNSEYAMLDALQQALKVLANSGYGSIANKHFRYFMNDIAQGITLTGQMLIRYVEGVVNRYFNNMLKTVDVDYVIAIDTDSCYINFEEFVKRVAKADTPKNKIVDTIDRFIKERLDPHINGELQKFADYLGAKKNLASMKRESIFDVCAWRGKKNYILQVWDVEDVRLAEPEIKCTGVEAKRSSTPKMIRKELMECYKVICNGTNEELLGRIDKFKQMFYNSQLQDIAFPRGVSDMDKWMQVKNGQLEIQKGAPIHVRGAINYNQLIANDDQLRRLQEPIKNGSKIKYLYLREPNVVRSHVIAFIDELPVEFGLSDAIDMEMQFDKTFLGPIKSFADLNQWRVDNAGAFGGVLLPTVRVPKQPRAIPTRGASFDDED